MKQGQNNQFLHNCKLIVCSFLVSFLTNFCWHNLLVFYQWQNMHIRPQHSLSCSQVDRVGCPKAELIGQEIWEPWQSLLALPEHCGQLWPESWPRVRGSRFGSNSQSPSPFRHMHTFVTEQHGFALRLVWDREPDTHGSMILGRSDNWGPPRISP